jgi:hypothetical protein
LPVNATVAAISPFLSFEGVVLAHVDFLDLDPEEGEQVHGGQLRPASRLIDVHFLAAQLLDRGDVGAGDDVNLEIADFEQIRDFV